LNILPENLIEGENQIVIEIVDHGQLKETRKEIKADATLHAFYYAKPLTQAQHRKSQCNGKRTVEYNTIGFLDKNKNMLNKDVFEVMNKTHHTNRFLGAFLVSGMHGVFLSKCWRK